MTSTEFVTRLRQQAPSKDRLRVFFEEDVAQIFIDGYSAKRKDSVALDSRISLALWVETISL